MKPTRHLVIFARVPAMGRVKTRLARDIGMIPAWQFYLESMRRTIRRLGDDARWQTWVALTPDRAGAESQPVFGAMPILLQGPGDLGHRMARAIRTVPPGPVVVVGTDIPALNNHHIWRAFRALGEADYAFGPATDGGYWLVGARPRARGLSLLRPRLFLNVRWSTPSALDDTLGNIGANETALLVDSLEDVDTGAAFAAARKQKP